MTIFCEHFKDCKFYKTYYASYQKNNNKPLDFTFKNLDRLPDCLHLRKNSLEDFSYYCTKINEMVNAFENKEDYITDERKKKIKKIIEIGD